CASPRLGGLGGRYSRLQNLRLSEAWGKPYEMNILPKRLRRSLTFVELKCDTQNHIALRRSVTSVMNIKG
ncbi:MAG: hypothetical protein ACK4GN_18855, partial [Runella sp.]